MLYAYGEDAMTLYALTERQEDLLKTLPDYKADDKYLFFYRPSFGRKGGETYSSFGEFDAIVASKSHIYLIESKWQRSNRAKNNRKLKLENNQIDRHKIFEWLWQQWNEKVYSSWQCFYEAKETYENKKKKLPKPSDLLARNLFFVLDKLKKHVGNTPPKIKNILLLFYGDEIGEGQRIDSVDDTFDLVYFKLPKDFFKEASGSKMFELNLSERKHKKRK